MPNKMNNKDADGYYYDHMKQLYYKNVSECCGAELEIVTCDERNRPITQKKIDEILLHQKTAEKIKHDLHYRPCCTDCGMFPAKEVQLIKIKEKANA